MIPIISSTAVLKYFDTIYPERQRWYSILFRSCEIERFRIVSNWLPQLKDKSLCDVGCGDGALMNYIFCAGNVPRNLMLQDISSSVIGKAKKKLSGFKCNISESAGDAFQKSLVNSYDVVIAIGITDYYKCWDDIIEFLLNSTSELLIIDFPRKWKLRNIPRLLWLQFNGLGFYVVSHRRLQNMISRHSCSFEIVKSEYNWIVKIDRKSV